MRTVDWPDDTLELMQLALCPKLPVKGPVVDVRYPVTVPVLTDEVELYCTRCGLWNLVGDWEDRARQLRLAMKMHGQCGDVGAARCPNCLTPPAPGHEHGELERRVLGLFTAVIPVPPRHYRIAYDPSSDRQAVNAIAACMLARRTARQAGLEPA